MAGSRARRINVPLRHVARVCAVMLFVLLGHVTVIQAFGSRALNSDPRNERPLIARYDHPRGDILTYDGTPVATSRLDRGGPYRYRRVYRHGELYAAVTGHLSLNRATGIEQAEDGVLSGQDARVKVRSLVRDGAVEGADVRLTISERVQWAAYQSLKATGVPGAAVAVDPATGAVLALATYPTYDPGTLATFDRERLAGVIGRLRADPGRPLVNRALDRLYPPGSTFKLITTAAALASREYTPTATVEAPARLRLPGTSTYVRNAGDRPCGNGRPTLLYAFQQACDTAFAGIGLQLGQDLLRDQAEAFGFNARDLTIPLPATPSRYPVAMDRAQTALTAIGRHESRVTPLMVAMMSAAVANNGVLMRPYLVQEVRLPDGSVINRANPTPYRTAVPPTLAKYLALMMTTVKRGGGTQVAVPGVRVAARTAVTRESPGTERNALVTAFAPADAPEVAVGVVLEDAGERAPAVGPVARAIIEAALS
ncbi:penicillin-binding transpeptidase domain-containing protein [Nonomuraea aridisoli]|uniref:Peptidoglycan glycosyltransferase n=1 Tax=Nonomuraea aridisoli TaxID=2070368 RepID=A0A2W2EB70_9ACTN|nr:penicillin-binding transpeptidase domain-containing protein [Nonomuraea aridisoli]PZG19691.1 peptidoglycan glycosyltransferase [Nonomuraea aridisoli]